MNLSTTYEKTKEKREKIPKKRRQSKKYHDSLSENDRKLNKINLNLVVLAF